MWTDQSTFRSLRDSLGHAWTATTSGVGGLVRRGHLSLPGLLLAAVFFALSVTPSLLPRTWVVQGFISGFSASVGYAVGVSLAWVWQRVVAALPRRWRPGRLRPSVRPALTAAAAALIAISLYQGSLWQKDLYLLMGAEPQGRPAYLGVLLMTLVLQIILIGVIRALRALARWIIDLLSRLIPRLPAQITGVLVVVLLVAGVLDGVVYDRLLSVASSTSESLNRSTGTSAAPPTSPTRSGSPASLVTWQSLGMQGRSFVTGGPTINQLRQFGGASAQEPIRAYVGLSSAPGVAAGAALAVRELERTGAFSRAVLCVVTTTGTGWIDPYFAAALEYLHNGDTAIVGTQYSYLPSWISFLTEREQVQNAGRELFNQVYARWSQLPTDQRPRLLVFGESLGSLGSEAAFRDLADVRAHTDGALWVGPTNGNPRWKELVVDRDPGSPEILPTYQRGAQVRFASNPADLERPPGDSIPPRVVYLQNPSDPVTWWSPQLVLNRPDWLADPPGYDVLPAMRWFPFVTYFQVTADLVRAEEAPPGHGHEFHRAAVAAWAAIAPPPNWSPARSAELTRLLDSQR